MFKQKQHDTEELIKKLLDHLTQNPDGYIFIVLERNEGYEFITNGCLPCFAEIASKFVELNAIPHLEETEENARILDTTNVTKH